MSALVLRDMARGEEQAVLDLVMAGFDELVRPDFSERGAAEFTQAARSFVLEHPVGHRITVAEEDGHVLAMIDVRDVSHICLFFVERGERGRGIGRQLLDAAVASSQQRGLTGEITVNSSPWAVPVYERLGFTSTGPEIEHNGMRALPMARPVNPRV